MRGRTDLGELVSFLSGPALSCAALGRFFPFTNTMESVCVPPTYTVHPGYPSPRCDDSVLPIVKIFSSC
ncbi:unnamed protein product [Arabis nemorensis]|uniref:Uncharacterized protein n=1 Tax=Arabis nemorensis TaxID=586526 RepID=A0A565BU72_9BRAS|nr:unnamed protein product [Arabis nemorensis]